MEFHVDVTAAPDEPLVTPREQILAGRAWLDEQTDLGVIRHWRSFRKTGGYMDVRMPAEDEETGRAQLAAWLAPYPLLDTITWTAEVLAPTPHAGFDELLGAQAAGLTIDEYQRVSP